MRYRWSALSLSKRTRSRKDLNCQANIHTHAHTPTCTLTHSQTGSALRLYYRREYYRIVNNIICIVHLYCTCMRPQTISSKQTRSHRRYAANRHTSSDCHWTGVPPPPTSPHIWRAPVHMHARTHTRRFIADTHWLKWIHSGLHKISLYTRWCSFRCVRQIWNMTRCWSWKVAWTCSDCYWYYYCVCMGVFWVVTKLIFESSSSFFSLGSMLLNSACAAAYLTHT